MPKKDLKEIGYFEQEPDLPGTFRCVIRHDRRFMWFGPKQEAWVQGTAAELQDMVKTFNRRVAAFAEENLATSNNADNLGLARMQAENARKALVLTEVLAKIEAVPH